MWTRRQSYVQFGVVRRTDAMSRARIVGLMATNTSPPKLRSLADDLRRRSDTELRDFIRLRPDTVEPIPADIAELASHASSAGSVRRAIDALAVPHLRMLTMLAHAPQPACGSVVPVACEQAGQAMEIVSQLWDSGLVWGVRPTGLDSDVNVVTAARDALMDSERDSANGPLDLTPTSITSIPLTLAKTLDGQGGQHALAAVTTLAVIGEHWSVNPPGCLKAGGLAVRELNAISELIGTDELTAAFWIELASAARLIGREESKNAYYAPTVFYDTWRQLDPGHQWAPVAAAWLRMDRNLDGMTSGVGERLSVLGEVASNTWRPELRTAVLNMLDDVGEGQVCEFPQLLEHLAERRPRARHDRLNLMAEATIREADLLGVVARGAITGLGRALIDKQIREEQLASIAREILPPVAEEFVAQADLTLVVPGPPSPSLRQLLNLVADVESTGGAAVFRVTAESAARALAGGLSPSDLIAELKTKSATPLPQPLEYLITDAARRHGGVRVGGAASWISSDDEALVTTMLAHPESVNLGLTRITPTVVISSALPGELLTFAASLGHIPTLVGDGGESVAVTRPAHRAPDPVLPVDQGIDDVFIAALATALRRSEIDEPAGVSIAAPHELPRMPTAATAQVLRRAQMEQAPVWVGYADNAGSMSRRLIDVVAADGGAISAFDHSHGRIRTLVLSRITGAVLADDINLPPIDENYDTAKERQ